MRVLDLKKKPTRARNMEKEEEFLGGLRKMSRINQIILELVGKEKTIRLGHM